MKIQIRTIALLALSPWAPGDAAETTVVSTPAEFQSALRSLDPGDTIVLADGTWRDFEIAFTGRGEPDRPVTLTAQTPGKVILSGRSNLRMAGEHLVVSDLIFRDGHSPTGEVVSFRRNHENRASNSRVTRIVIDGFNKPNRLESDNWVALYGHDNRFDHSHLVGKTNAGTTLVVVRDEQQGLINRHRIDHNFFGPRPNLGMNGGETIRVGTSHDSLSDSHTLVERNWFEHCDGEVEIVSNKSGANTYRGNVFFESRGSLVLRHGSGNLVENNIFLGGGLHFTGGIRVINSRQTVRNNYLEGLRGEGFASAIAVMYGIPNSPQNRYHQVNEVTLTNNSIIDSTRILIGAGKDEERSAPPINSRFENNLIVNQDGHAPLRIQGEIPGMRFKSNVSNIDTPAISGIKTARVTLVRNAHGLLMPEESIAAGASHNLIPVTRAETGVQWYPKERAGASLDSGKVTEVSPGDRSLQQAIAQSSPGERLRLAPGRYHTDQVLHIEHPITIEGTQASGALLTFSRPTLFELGRHGSLRLAGLTISGKHAPDTAGNAVIRTRAGSGAANYVLTISDTRFEDLTMNRAFDVFAAAKSTMADRITLERVEVARISGDVIAADSETDDLGFYNVERLQITDSKFSDVAGTIVDLYRGGSDESTFGPQFVFSGNVLERVKGGGSQPAASLHLHGVQFADIKNNRCNGCAGFRIVRPVGEPVVQLDDAARQLVNVVP